VALEDFAHHHEGFAKADIEEALSKTTRDSSISLHMLVNAKRRKENTAGGNSGASENSA
jgi:hypothetical protein